MRGSRTVPPSTSGMPWRRSKKPKWAVSPVTRRSHIAASSMPPATHQPSIAAMTGFAMMRRVGPSGPSSRRSGSLLRLAPELNAFSSP